MISIIEKVMEYLVKMLGYFVTKLRRFIGEDSGEKTKQPTPHKLSELKEKGQIAKVRFYYYLITVAYFL